MFPIGDQNEQGRGLAYVTLAFIAINVAVFVLFQLGNEAFTYAFSAVPFEITTGEDLVRPQPVDVGGERLLIPQEPGPEPIYLTLLTSMFMHGGIAHIGGNMLFLFIFGDNVEHRMGPILFAGFYLLAGLVASLAQILVDPNSVVPTLGASGAISGVLGAYLVMFPGNRVTVFLFRFLTAVPAIVAIGMWAVFQFLNGYGQLFASQETTGGVAYMAHIGGFVAGVVVGLLFRGAGSGRARPQPAF
ncbi:MAG: rhomboid family intramembrane serine protease [Chloroflexi bacterium]|nr:rhomboid family intramembrane serine protease [Chloroflexota bacterium]